MRHTNTTSAAREAARRDSGRFGTQHLGEVPDLTLHDARGLPRLDGGAVDHRAAVEMGIIDGFGTAEWAEPDTMTLIGHWDGDTIVVEWMAVGDVADDREDTGHWPDGLWSSSASGRSNAELAASVLDAYAQSRRIKVAEFDHELTPDEREDCFDA